MTIEEVYRFIQKELDHAPRFIRNKHDYNTGFVLGVLQAMKENDVISNKESGFILEFLLNQGVI